MLQYLILSASSTGNKGIHTMSLENNPQKDIGTMTHPSGKLPESMRETLGSWTTGTEATPSPIEKQKRFSNKQKLVAATALALSLVVGGFESMNSGDKRVAPASPVATAPVAVPNTAETTSPVTPETTPANQAEVAPTVKNQEMDATLFTNPELLAKTFTTERQTAWINAGATPENARAAFDTHDVAAYAVKVGAEYDKMFTEALLVTDWQSRPELVDWVNKISDIHRGTLNMYFLTALHVDRRDKAPYARGDEYDKLGSVIPNKNGSLSITTTEHQTDNADQNRVGEDLGISTGIDTSEVTSTRIFIKDGGKIKLISVILDQQ